METLPYSEFDLVSHPDRTLYQHLAECDRISGQILAFKHFSSEFPSMKIIDNWRRWLVWYHDFGKGTDYFQHRMIEIMEDRIQENASDGFIESQKSYIHAFRTNHGHIVSEELRRDKNLGSHARLGAYYLFGAFSDENPVVEIILLKVIQRHHGHLTNFIKDKNENHVVLLIGETLDLLEKQHARFHFELYNKILAAARLPLVDVIKWELVKAKFSNPRAISRLEITLREENTYRYFFLQHYLFSLLLSADKGDMQLPKNGEVRTSLIRTNHLIDPKEELVERYKSALFNSVNPKPIDAMREQAFNDVAQTARTFGDRSFFSITLPTGLGKTFAAFKAAFLLQNQFAQQTDTNPRIVYCLPFTSVIDQNAAQLQDIFKFGRLPQDWISVHHYLSIPNERYDDLVENQYELGFQGSEYMTEGWEQDVVATTFVQFLESIFTNKNRALRKFHNLAHAIIVLDEVQAIPPKYFGAVEVALKHLAAYFGTKFLFVTATQPILFAQKEEIIELTDPTLEKTEGYFSQMNRIELDISLLQKHNFQAVEDQTEIKEEILQDIRKNPEKSFLIICNTIKQSQEIYRFLQTSLPETDIPIRYLSSSIIPYCRRNLIGEIRARKQPQILVSTQVVEAGVDIDFDVVYRDWAPLDSINQSAGRCNRSGLDRYGKGKVRLFHSGKARYIYDSKLLGATKGVLQEFPESIIPEGQFLNLNNRYAQAVKRAVADENPVSEKLKTAMKTLQLEDIATLFQLIGDEQQAYSVFIPFKDEKIDAMNIWNEYQETRKIENSYDRKAIVKRVLPKLLPFVTRFQKKHYDPPSGQEKENIIFDPSWRLYYNETLGFIKPGDAFF